MPKNIGQLIGGIVVGLILGLLIGKQVFHAGTVVPPQPEQPTHTEERRLLRAKDDSPRDNSIPPKVYEVLQYVRANNHSLPGYVGGRVFSNREERLPREDNNGHPVLYHEWDVNPKVEGQNRGTERLITGSDGRAWYTDDHYQTFKPVR